MVTAAEINLLNQRFWADQHVLFEQQMADTALRDTAWEIVNSEVERGVPIRKQSSIYEALQDANRMGQRFRAALARKGGKANKTDALQQIIQNIVEQNPSITVAELEDKLKAQQGLGAIDDFDDETITFCRTDGRLKEAKRSGLKDRLWRAKKVHSR